MVSTNMNKISPIQIKGNFSLTLYRRNVNVWLLFEESFSAPVSVRLVSVKASKSYKEGVLLLLNK